MVESQPEIDIAAQLLTPQLNMFEEIESARFDKIQSDKTVSHVQATSRSCLFSRPAPPPPTNELAFNSVTQVTLARHIQLA